MYLANVFKQKPILYSIIFAVAMALLFITCEKTTTQPPPAGPDTTSHNFTWQVTHVGDLTSSLADVFAIAEDDIWAVGKIQIEDSAGNDKVYNAVHWNGQEWELKQMLFKIFCNQTTTQISPAKSVFALKSNDVWISAGSQITHWDGFSQDILECIPASVNQLWIHSNQKIYTVGSIGQIAHYNGSNWQKQESNTTVRLLDVWGNTNGSALWACGYASNNSESILLRSDGSQWQIVWQWQFQQGASDSAYVGLLSSLWAFDPDSLIIVSGDGVFRQDIANNGPPRKENLFLDAFPLRVRGSAANNIFICGDNGRVWHYNGATWQTYPELHNPNWVFRSIAVLENKVVAVGWDFSQIIQRDIIVTGLRP